jgi:hypothetical protein
MRLIVQATVDQQTYDRIDDLRRKRKPLDSAAALLRELLDLGIEAYEAKQQRQHKKEKAAATEAR